MSKIASYLNFISGSDTTYIDLVAAEYDAEFSMAEKRVRPSNEIFIKFKKDRPSFHCMSNLNG